MVEYTRLFHYSIFPGMFGLTNNQKPPLVFRRSQKLVSLDRDTQTARTTAYSLTDERAYQIDDETETAEHVWVNAFLRMNKDFNASPGLRTVFS
jgi:hypothetical protein